MLGPQHETRVFMVDAAAIGHQGAIVQALRAVLEECLSRIDARD
jgi:predicted RNA-binding protein YlqC (UPF0109 family)